MVDFSSILIKIRAQVYYVCVKYLYVTYFLTSSIAVFEALILVKSMYMIKSW